MDKHEESYRASPLWDFVPIGDHKTPRNTLTVRPKTGELSAKKIQNAYACARPRVLDFFVTLHITIFSSPCEV